MNITKKDYQVGDITTKAQATKLIKMIMKDTHQIVAKLDWSKFGKTKTPTGLKGVYGFVKISGDGFNTKDFTFTYFPEVGYQLK